MASMVGSAPRPKQQTKVSLSLDEISKLFSLPIAEAASILGVCTRVLKRICRSHGIARWPYRKLVSGRTVDDVMKDIKVDGSTDVSEQSKLDEQVTAASKVVHLGSINSSTSLKPTHLPDVPNLMQVNFATAGQTFQASRFSLTSPSALTQITQTKGVPSYMDDFKLGFPSSGLSSVPINKWWGTSGDPANPAAIKEESQESCDFIADAAKCMTDDEMDSGADDSSGGTVGIEPSALLCSLRRKAVEDGRELLKNRPLKAHELLCTQNKRQKACV